MNSDIISAALTLDILSPHWRVQLQPDEMVEFARRCMYYNDITQEGMLRLLQDIDSAIPRMQFQEGNLNNGKQCYYYHIGNEGSRVLYVEIRKQLMSHPLGSAWLEKELRLAAQAAGANEYYIAMEDKHTLMYRIWWD
jgi:hypothetical protein